MTSPPERSAAEPSAAGPGAAEPSAAEPSAAEPSAARRLGHLVAPGYVDGDDPSLASKGLRAALLRYKVMAYIVGVGLLILVFVGVPLQYGATIPQVAEIVGPIHGFLYIVYLLASVDLARRARFTLLQMAAMVAAGFLPFLAFIIERQVAKRVEALLVDPPG